MNSHSSGGQSYACQAVVNNDDHTRLGYDGQVASVLFSRAIGLASSDMDGFRRRQAVN